MMQATGSHVIEVHWAEDARGEFLYAIYSRLPGGQMRLESTMEQGPFDTAVEVAQWAWRVIARLVPPSRG